MNRIFHDSHDIEYRKPFGAVASSQKVRLNISIGKGIRVKSVKIDLSNNESSFEKCKMKLLREESEYSIYTYEVDTSNFTGIIWYHFTVESECRKTIYGNNDNRTGGKGRVYGDDEAVVPYQITVCSPDYKVPSWYKNSIMYQIFPDRFFNGNEDKTINKPGRDMVFRGEWDSTPAYIKDQSGRVLYYDFFGGNLKGITKKLDYLKSLGIGAIYLNPIFESASNHKYDIGDYEKIDSMFGDEDAFRELCKEAEQRGIRLILDGVFSHTGSDSKYFNKNGRYDTVGAYQSKKSKYYGWYRFGHYPDTYQSWWGVDVMPNVDELEPSYLDYMVRSENSIVERWIELGARGWRLDVADELPDEFIVELRKKLKGISEENVLIGEVWEDASNKISYGNRRSYLFGDELDSVMNYPFKDNFLNYFKNIIDSNRLAENIMSLYENYPTESFYGCMNLIGSHDSVRILNELAGISDLPFMTEEEKAQFSLDDESRSRGISRLKVLSAIQMTFPGVPSIYYGDEAGLEGFSDPTNRRTYPWGREDKDLLGWYKKLTKLRNEHGVFRTGDFKIEALDKDSAYYVRQIKHGRDVFGEKCRDNLAIVVFNRLDEVKNVAIDLSSYGPKDLYEVITGKSHELKNGMLELEIRGLTAIILIGNKK